MGFEPLPNTRLGQSPASAAPALIAIGIGQKTSHHASLTHNAAQADRTAASRNIAAAKLSARGLANGPLNARRYSRGCKSIDFPSSMPLEVRSNG